jgi:hypothetical protein
MRKHTECLLLESFCSQKRFQLNDSQIKRTQSERRKNMEGKTKIDWVKNYP